MTTMLAPRLDYDETRLIIQLAGGCSLDEKPGTNWVQENGGLPNYICRIARAVKRSGHDTSSAIAIAVSRVKVWASGKGVSAKTQAKAAAAVAEWEALRGKAAGKRVAKEAKKVAASNGGWADSEDHYLFLCADNFNTDAVRRAWEQKQQDARKAWYAKQKSSSGKSDGADVPSEPSPGYSYIRELWTTYLIVDGGEDSPKGSLMKVPFNVDKSTGEVTFQDPIPVKVQYVAADGSDITDPDGDDDPDLDGSDLTDEDMQKLMNLANSSSMDRMIVALAGERHVRTEQGAKLFGVPIGSVIGGRHLQELQSQFGRNVIQQHTGPGAGNLRGVSDPATQLPGHGQALMRNAAQVARPGGHFLPVGHQVMDRSSSSGVIMRHTVTAQPEHEAGSYKVATDVGIEKAGNFKSMASRKGEISADRLHAMAGVTPAAHAPGAQTGGLRDGWQNGQSSVRPNPNNAPGGFAPEGTLPRNAAQSRVMGDGNYTHVPNKFDNPATPSAKNPPTKSVAAESIAKNTSMSRSERITGASKQLRQDHPDMKPAQAYSIASSMVVRHDKSLAGPKAKPEPTGPRATLDPSAPSVGQILPKGKDSGTSGAATGSTSMADKRELPGGVSKTDAQRLSGEKFAAVEPEDAGVHAVHTANGQVYPHQTREAAMAHAAQLNDANISERGGGARKWDPAARIPKQDDLFKQHQAMKVPAHPGVREMQDGTFRAETRDGSDLDPKVFSSAKAAAAHKASLDDEERDQFAEDEASRRDDSASIDAEIKAKGAAPLKSEKPATNASGKLSAPTSRDKAADGEHYLERKGKSIGIHSKNTSRASDGTIMDTHHGTIVKTPEGKFRVEGKEKSASGALQFSEHDTEAGALNHMRLNQPAVQDVNPVHAEDRKQNNQLMSAVARSRSDELGQKRTEKEASSPEHTAPTPITAKLGSATFELRGGSWVLTKDGEHAASGNTKAQTPNDIHRLNQQVPKGTTVPHPYTPGVQVKWGEDNPQARGAKTQAANRSAREANTTHDIQPGQYHVKGNRAVGKAHMIVKPDGSGTYVNSRGEKKDLSPAAVKKNHEAGMNHNPGSVSDSRTLDSKNRVKSSVTEIKPEDREAARKTAETNKAANAAKRTQSAIKAGQDHGAYQDHSTVHRSDAMSERFSSPDEARKRVNQLRGLHPDAGKYVPPAQRTEVKPPAGRSDLSSHERHANEQIREMADGRDRPSVDARGLIRMREDQARQSLKDDPNGHVTLKVPSFSEASIHPDLVRDELKIAKPSSSDELKPGVKNATSSLSNLKVGDRVYAPGGYEHVVSSVKANGNGTHTVTTSGRHPDGTTSHSWTGPSAMGLASASKAKMGGALSKITSSAKPSSSKNWTASVGRTPRVPEDPADAAKELSNIARQVKVHEGKIERARSARDEARKSGSLAVVQDAEKQRVASQATIQAHLNKAKAIFDKHPQLKNGPARHLVAVK